MTHLQLYNYYYEPFPVFNCARLKPHQELFVIQNMSRRMQAIKWNDKTSGAKNDKKYEYHKLKSDLDFYVLMWIITL